jgi:hypothetical protein
LLRRKDGTVPTATAMTLAHVAGNANSPTRAPRTEMLVAVEIADTEPYRRRRANVAPRELMSLFSMRRAWATKLGATFDETASWLKAGLESSTGGGVAFSALSGGRRTLHA